MKGTHAICRYVFRWCIRMTGIEGFDLDMNKQNDLHTQSSARKCVFVAATGRQCGCYALTGSEYCFNHDPESAAARAEARKKGGAARQGRVIGLAGESRHSEPVTIKTVADVLAVIQQGVNDLLLLENSFARAKALTGLTTVALKAIEVGSLEERIAALESRLETRSQGELKSP